MQISKSLIAALCCVLLFLAVPGRAIAASPASYTVTYTAESEDSPSSQSADSDTFDPFNMLEESDQQESGQFGTMPDMKLMLEAVKIIGDTPLDELDADQLSRLGKLGIDRTTLYENADLITEMLAALSDPDAADIDSGEEDPKTAFAIAAAFGVVLAALCVMAVHYGGRKRT